MSDLIDRMARVLDPRAFAEHDDSTTFNWVSRRRTAATKARKVLAAIREPLLDDVRTLHGFSEPYNDATVAVHDRVAARLAEIDEALR